MVISYNTNSQNKDDKITDWELPLNTCTDYLPLNGKPQKLASDNARSIYFSVTGNKLISFNLEKKKVNWESNLGSKIVSNIKIYKEHILIVTKDDLDEKIKLWSVSNLTGITVWQKTFNLSADKILLSSDDAGIYLKVERDIFQINDKNGNISSNLDRTVYDKTKFPASKFEKLDKIKNISNEDSDIFSETKESIIVGDKSGRLILYNKFSATKVWERKLGGEITDIQKLSNNEILISSLDNFLYLVSGKNGNFIWKRRLPYRISDIYINDDKVAFVMNLGSSSIFIIELKEGKIINNINLPDSIYTSGDALVVGETILIPTDIGIFLYSQRSC